MMVVGLTGGIGSGKTTVANYFKDLGVPIYIADIAGKSLMETSTTIKQDIIELLGAEAYNDDLPDRKWIASVVFKDPSKLEDLNKIIHPAVKKDFEEWKLQQTSDYVIYEAAILFEMGGYKACDKTILVTAPMKLRVKRLQNRDGSSVEEIQLRMNNQWSDEKKSALADFVIENVNLNQTKAQVKKLHQIILKTIKN